MSVRVATAVRDEGRPVAVKRARNGHEAVRLRNEAALLDAARHPGVVELVELVDDGDRVELVTAFVGPHSLATCTRMAPEQTAGFVAELASVVADLHEAGLVHGRVEPSHVLIGAAGRPVLCGFAGGGRSGAPPPSHPDAKPLATADDVGGLGELLHHLVADNGSDLEPIPDQRLPLHRRSRWSGWQRRVLLTVADQATADEPNRRPSARQLAAAISEAMPGATLPDPQPPAASPRWSPVRFHDPDTERVPSDASDAASRLAPVTKLLPRKQPTAPRGVATAPQHARPRRGPNVRPWLVGGGAVAGVALIVVGAASLRAPRGPRVPGAGPEVAATAAPTEVASVGAATTPVVLERAGARFAVGQPGDRAVVGDWDCDGLPTAALLRPSTGAVFVFPSWAEPDEQLAVPPITVVDGGEGLLAEDDDGDGCAALVVALAGGGRRTVMP